MTWIVRLFLQLMAVGFLAGCMPSPMQTAVSPVPPVAIETITEALTGRRAAENRQNPQRLAHQSLFGRSFRIVEMNAGSEPGHRASLASPQAA